MRSLEPWLEPPLGRFLEESGARLVLITTSAGQVVAQHGFLRAVDVMTVAALAAAVSASTDELARQLGEPGGRAVVHQGPGGGYVLGRLDLPRGRWLCLAGFGAEARAGVVQLFHDRLASELAGLAPAGAATAPPLAENFERELNGSLQALFGR